MPARKPGQPLPYDPSRFRPVTPRNAKTRRYIALQDIRDTDEDKTLLYKKGDTVSRRLAEDLTAKQRAARMRKKYVDEGFGGYQTPIQSERHYIRYGPYATLRYALSEPSIRPNDEVLIGAEGIPTEQSPRAVPRKPRTLREPPGPGEPDYRMLWSLSRYGALKQAALQEQAALLFVRVDGYYVWVSRGH